LLVCTVYSVLYSEIALSRKPFGIGHVYRYIFLLRMTGTMTSQNIDFSSWDILYNTEVDSFTFSLRNVFVWKAEKFQKEFRNSLLKITVV
jgi:hypothetical protein